ASRVWGPMHIDQPDFSLLRGLDVIGLVLMAVSLGCLEYGLEEGPRWDWLDEKTIRAAVIVSAVAGSLFFWRVVSYRQPIVDLRAFLHRNFALGSFLHAGHRDVRHHLLGAAVPGPGPRLQRFASDWRSWCSRRSTSTSLVRWIYA